MARTSSLFDWTMPGILFLALAFRLIGLGYGLPFVYHQDEPIIVHHALAMGVDGLRAHFFVIPPFCSALLFFLYAAGYLAGRGLGRWDDADGFGVAFFNDPTYFYLAGRAVLGVMFGVLTVYAVYRLGRRHVSAGAGRYAALLLALTPMHVQQSHYIYADIPLALAVTLLLDRFLALMRKPTPAHYLAVGAILGWATAIKYTALYFLPIMAVAHALAWGRRSVCRGALIRLFAAGAACVLWFAVFAPSVVLNLRECFNQLLHQKGSEEQVGLWHHGVYSLAEGTGWLMMAAAVTGLVVLWKRPTTRASAWIFLSMICVYYGINVGFSQPFARYMMPLVPVIALAAAAGWASLPDGTKLARIGKWALAVLMTGELAVVSIYGDGLFLRTDTRTAAWEWVQQNVPAGAAVAVDNRFFAPPLKKTYAEYSEASIDSPADAKREIRRKRLYLESKSDVDERRYRVYTL